jgi:hypothetical protein
MKTHAPQYTVRGIPIEVDRALRERAKQRKVSINQVIIDELTIATIGRKQFADFSGFVGRWTPDPAFDEILERQREINANDWL